MVQITQPRNIREWIRSSDREFYKRRYLEKVAEDLGVSVASADSWFNLTRSPNKERRHEAEAYLSKLTGISKENLFKRFRDDEQAPI